MAEPASEDEPEGVNAALHGAPIPDAPDAGWLTRAAIALIGRPPTDAQERAALNGVLAAGGRSALIDHLTTANYADEYVRHWSSLFLDIFRVYRLPEGGRTRASCWNAASLTAAQQTSAAEHVASEPTSSAWPGGSFTMRDVVEGSIRADDLRAPLRANLFAQLATPVVGNQATEPNVRADLWTRFESAYLNRQILCLSCHNNAFSVTGNASDWDRHAPLPDLFEKAVFGSSHAGNVIPPNLHADFRHDGVADGSLAPWGLQGCGTYNPSPTPQTVESGFTCPETPPEVILVTMPGNRGALADPCYVADPAEPLVRRAPQPSFALAGGVGSVFRLDQLLASGMASLALTGLDDIPSAPPSGENTRAVAPAGTPEGAQRAFAIMVAANIAERVWEELFGSRLTLAHSIPRADQARNALHALTQTLLRAPTGDAWSLRTLLRVILLRPEFNAAAATGVADVDEYALDRLFNPWVTPDNRPAPIDSERCGSGTPTYEGCVRGLLRLYRCVNCHENDEIYPLFDHTSVDDIRSFTLTTGQCEALATSSSCTSPIDCSRVGGKPASRLAVRVSCTAEGARMPRGLAPMARTDIDALIKWVENDAPTGTRGPAPALPADTTVNQATHNGVGDRVSWKSPYQLTASMGSALGLHPWSAGPFPGPTSYPNLEAAISAGHHLTPSIPGGRGMSILSLLDWEKAHQNGDPCRVWAADDRIDDLVARTLANDDDVEQVVSDLKQSMLGEGAFEDAGPSDERALIETVLGGPSLTEPVTASNASAVEAGLRRVCRVWLKSPLFLLSYVEPADTAALTAPMIIAADSELEADDSDEAVALSSVSRGRMRVRWPALCADRLDCRPYAPALEATLDACASRPSSCAGANGDQVQRQTTTALRDLRLPVARPTLTFSTALREEPQLVPSAEDPRMKSRLLVLPFGGARVEFLRGRIEALRGGRLRRLRRGDTVAYGEVLFIDSFTYVAVRVGNDIYRTSLRGMEVPPHPETSRGHLAALHRPWIVVANGPEASEGPPASFDPNIPIGAPHPLVSEPPQLVGVQPAWAVYGEGGLWYSGRGR